MFPEIYSAGPCEQLDAPRLVDEDNSSCRHGRRCVTAGLRVEAPITDTFSDPLKLGG